MTELTRSEKARNAFLAVRDNIDQKKYRQAYRLAFKKPFKFYEGKTTEEAIAILIEEGDA